MTFDLDGPIRERGLNEAQKRAVAVRMQALERFIAEAERFIAVDEAEEPARGCALLSESQRQALREAFEQIRCEIASIVAELNLESEADNYLSYVRAVSAELWADLIDIEPPKLRRYGPVDPEVIETLSPTIDRLVMLTSAVYSIANQALMPHR
ncbi:MAG: hypothetical protein U0822_13465 [Anaerolineae bacterium]